VLKTILKTSGYLACLLVSGIASATGLGGMAVNSNLGQPLKAEIELVAVDKADRNSIVAKLASVEAFKAAGIEYPYALPKLKFAIINRDSAQPRVMITSTQPVNEPFVTLLVEVSWPSGKLMREYTFLLDPVGFSVEPQAETVKPIAPVATVAPVVSEPVAVPEPVTVPEPVMAPEAMAEPAPVEAAPAAAEAAAMEPAPAEAVATETAPVEGQPAEPAAAEMPAEVKVEAAPVMDDALSKEEAIPVAETIKVVRGDTLSKIAFQTKPADVSLERMLVALYRANTDAFMGKNMNRLKAGKIIRVPDAAEIEAVQQDEAVKVYRAQVDDWNAYRQQLAAARTEAREQTAQQGTSGKVTAAVTEKAISKEAPTEVLKLSKGEAPGDKTSGGSASSKEEESVAKAKALKEAQDRTALLEKNVKDLERLAELKKQQAAAAQKTAPAPEAGVPTASVGASAPVPAKPAAKPAIPAPVEVPQVEVSLVDSLLGDPVLLGGAGAGLVALLGAGFWLSRRRAAPVAVKAAVASSDSGDAGSSTGRIAEPVMPSPDTGDFTRQADEVAEENHSDEVDPIAEADLFLTFGRDVQAEEVLKEALNSKPGDVPIILKLLSIYSTRKDTNAFMTYARQIKDGGDEAAWLQVAAMGRELEPGNPFYGGEGEVGGAAASQVEEAAEPAVDFDLGFGTSGSEKEEPNALDTMMMDTFATEKSEDATQAEDFLGTVVMQPQAKSSESTTILSAQEMQAASEAPMDFDITGAHQDNGSAAEAEKSVDVGGAEPAASDDLIFDVTSTHPGVPSQMAEAADSTAKSAESDDLMFDVTSTHSGFQAPLSSATTAEPAASGGLDDLMFDITSAQPEDAAATKAAPADDSLAFTLDIPEDVRPAGEKPSAPMDIGLGDISLNLDGLGGSDTAGAAAEVKDERWQEVATKLDLAKAYQEMGDGAGAKEILDEVMRDGDEQQRASAQSILDQL
jgi:pilus assembly protein FimV